jgi:WS/DGAT/MGAT family acyltransferase
LEDVRTAVAARLHLLPRFRRNLHEPAWGLGGPYWSDAPHFDIAEHVGHVERAHPADEATLLDEVERLRIRPLDRSRPLWEMWFLTGLDDGRIGLYVKLHHALADGFSGVLQVGALLDPGPVVPDRAPLAWSAARAPTRDELLADGLRRRSRAAGSRIAHPVRWLRDLRDTAQLLRHSLGRPPAPITSVNQKVGDHRRIVLVRFDLDRMRSAAHRSDATINDVLLAAVAGGYRSLLLNRGEPVDGVVLRASVPVSLHAEDPGATVANHDGMILAPLPVGIDDPLERLAAIAVETARLKEHVDRPPTGALATSRLAQGALWRHFDHQRWSNGYVANIPGPAEPLRLVGAPVSEVFPIVPIMGNLTIGVGAMSYAGQFTITVVADADTCADVEVFATALRRSLEELDQTTVTDARARYRAEGRAGGRRRAPEPRP